MQSVQWIETYEAESDLASSPVNERSNVSKIAAAPVSTGAQTIQRYIEAGCLPTLLEHSRQISPIGTNNQVGLAKVLTIHGNRKSVVPKRDWVGQGKQVRFPVRTTHLILVTDAEG